MLPICFSLLDGSSPRAPKTAEGERAQEDHAPFPHSHREATGAPTRGGRAGRNLRCCRPFETGWARGLTKGCGFGVTQKGRVRTPGGQLPLPPSVGGPL